MSMQQTLAIPLFILALTRLVIAVQLFRVARKKNLPNLLWLTLFFCATTVGDIGVDVLNIGVIFGVCMLISEIALVMFIHRTFYQDRKSPYLIFLAFAVIFGVNGILTFSSSASQMAPTWNPFGWGWLLVVAYQAYRQIAADKSVEDWIKVRYQLMIAYCVAYLVSPLLTVLGVAAAFFPALGSFVGTTAAVMTISAQYVSIVLQYFTWVMPEFFRRFLNRKYVAPSDQAQAYLGMSQEELLLQVQGK